MKVTYRIPTEMYAFTEITEDLRDDAPPEVIKEQYDIYINAFRPKPINSLSDKDFNKFLDNYLLGEDNHVEVYEQMSPDQKSVIQEVKKSLKRIKSKQTF